MPALGPDVLKFDMDAEVERIGARLREILRKDLNRRGLVVAMSGGIDSSVCSALAVKALGPKKVFGLLLPEVDSSGESKSRGQLLAEHLGIEYLIEDIGPTLNAIGCYRWRDEAIRNVFPEYTDGWKNKIVISGGTEGQVNHFQLVVQTPDGEEPVPGTEVELRSSNHEFIAHGLWNPHSNIRIRLHKPINFARSACKFSSPFRGTSTSGRNCEPFR